EGESIYHTNREISELIIKEDIGISNEILEKSKDFVIGGLASSSTIDLENERITRHALETIWEHIQTLDEKLLNVCLSHSSTQIGTVLLKYRNRRSALLDEGLYLICKLRRDIPIARDAIKKIESGELNSFSIKIGIPESLTDNIKTVCDEDMCWRDLEKAYFIELSLTDSPANPDCEGTVEILH
ncbi:MAG: HK97 family phage prohead protease, partial [Candidatus Heimdallarchaeota archaeon]|nr:HK97 family phage prohead protease [Candidatus Heimdallarchaeota archaeon]